jgi:hypothetical protein
MLIVGRAHAGILPGVYGPLNATGTGMVSGV